MRDQRRALTFDTDDAPKVQYSRLFTSGASASNMLVKVATSRSKNAAESSLKRSNACSSTEKRMAQKRSYARSLPLECL